MIELQKRHIDEAIPKVKIGLEKYLWIQNELYKRNVFKDREFQKKFNGFYRIRRNLTWQNEFYRLLENSKSTPTDFKTTLNKLHKKTARMEASFVSKLIATLDPKQPIIDKVVFTNLGLTLPSINTKNREVIICELYQTLHKELSSYLKTENGKYLVNQFNKSYPLAKITHMKMLDLVLWQTRN